MSVNIKKTAKTVISKGLVSILRSKLLVRLAPFNNPPLMILSYPRSGSSWIGKVLSTSPSVAYLREPITQPYLFRYGGSFALVDVDNNPSAFSIYRRLGDEAFQGIPPVHPYVVNNWQDYSYSMRKRKRLLIKEVNPKAVNFYCEKYQAKVLLLIRHPAAIALSFYHLGWLESPDAQLETANPNAGAWEKFGYAYGSIMYNTIQTLKARGDHAIIVYKHIAQDPYSGFKKLFRALDLEIPENYDAIINKYCFSPNQNTERGEIERTSKNMIFKWRNELTNQQIADLQAGYLQSKLEYFRESADWQPADTGAHI